MGLIAGIYKNKGRDFSNGGISSRYEEVTVINADGPFEPSEDRPAVRIVAGPYGTVRIVPVAVDKNGQEIKQWYMMGGTYIGCSDSRFGEAIKNVIGHEVYGAIAFHDRVE